MACMLSTQTSGTAGADSDVQVTVTLVLWAKFYSGVTWLHGIRFVYLVKCARTGEKQSLLLSLKQNEYIITARKKTHFAFKPVNLLITLTRIEG